MPRLTSRPRRVPRHTVGRAQEEGVPLGLSVGPGVGGWWVPGSCEQRPGWAAVSASTGVAAWEEEGRFCMAPDPAVVPWLLTFRSSQGRVVVAPGENGQAL